MFGRKIGANQGIQFPLAKAYAATEAAALMVQQAAHLYEAGQGCAAEANMAKYLGASERTPRPLASPPRPYSAGRAPAP